MNPVDENGKIGQAKQMYLFDVMDICHVGVGIAFEPVTDTGRLAAVMK